MNDKVKDDGFSAVVVAVLLILTAWGNALAMVIVGALGLVLCLLFRRETMARGGWLTATVGFVVAFVIAIVMLVA